MRLKVGINQSIEDDHLTYIYCAKFKRCSQNFTSIVHHIQNLEQTSINQIYMFVITNKSYVIKLRFNYNIRIFCPLATASVDYPYLN